MKFDRSSLLLMVYCLFTLLYTLYSVHHFRFGSHKGTEWWYYIRFMLISGYFFYILQGAILRSTNWGIVLLLPLVILAATILSLFILVGIIRLGGGDLLDRDYADMVLVAIVYCTFSGYALRWIRPGKKKKKGR